MTMFRRSTARLLTGPLAFLIAGVIDVAAALMAHGFSRGRRR